MIKYSIPSPKYCSGAQAVVTRSDSRGKSISISSHHLKTKATHPWSLALKCGAWQWYSFSIIVDIAFVLLHKDTNCQSAFHCWIHVSLELLIACLSNYTQSQLIRAKHYTEIMAVLLCFMMKPERTPFCKGRRGATTQALLDSKFWRLTKSVYEKSNLLLRLASENLMHDYLSRYSGYFLSFAPLLSCPCGWLPNLAQGMDAESSIGRSEGREQFKDERHWR